MNVPQISRWDADETVKAGFNAPLSPQFGVIRLAVPAKMIFRTVFFFMEALTTVAGADFYIDGELEFRRNNCGIHSVPASLASNTNNSGIVQKTAFSFFANVAAGTSDALFVVIGAQFVGGSQSVSITPHNFRLECDEVHFNIRGAQVNAGGSFSNWRAILAIRSSLELL